MSNSSSVLKQSLSGLVGTCAGAHEATLCSSGALGDDIDDPINRICAPDRASGTADHLNAVDVLQRYILLVPIDTRGERRVHAPSVDQDQHFISVTVREAANANRPNVGVELCDMY